MTTRIARLVTIAAFVFGFFGAFGVPAASAGTEYSVYVVEENNSGVSGQAHFTDTGDGSTTVVINVDGYNSGNLLLAAIHDGKASDYKAEALYEVNDVVDGSSTTVLPISLMELRSETRTIVIRDAAGGIVAYGSMWSYG